MKITNNVKEFFELNDPFVEYAECIIYLNNKCIAKSNEVDAVCRPIIEDDSGEIISYDRLMEMIKDYRVESVDVDWRIAIYLTN